MKMILVAFVGTLLTLLLTLLIIDSAVAATRTDRDCAKTYTRAHFHQAAKSTFSSAFPSSKKKRTLARIIRCQRRHVSVVIVRKHRKRYRHEWTQRFWAQHEWARVPSWVKQHLESIASCESGGNPRAIGGGGSFRGKYQFTFSTWRTVGGSGDPAAAPEIEQDVRAARLLMKHGAGHWPVCG